VNAAQFVFVLSDNPLQDRGVTGSRRLELILCSPPRRNQLKLSLKLSSLQRPFVRVDRRGAEVSAPLKLAEMFRSRGLELSRVSVLNRFKPSNSVGCLQHFRFVPRLLSGALGGNRLLSLLSASLRLSTSPFVLL
jgi:hypothetical protein